MARDDFDFGDDDLELASGPAGRAPQEDSMQFAGGRQPGPEAAPGSSGHQPAGSNGAGGNGNDPHAASGHGAAGQGGAAQGASGHGAHGQADPRSNEEAVDDWASSMMEEDEKDREKIAELERAHAEEEAEWAPTMAAVMNGGSVFKRNCRGQGVAELQSRLNAAGVEPQIPTHGYFDDETESAVRAVQRSAGLAVTGEVNRRTIEAIRDHAVAAVNQAPDMLVAPSITDVLGMKAAAILPGQEGRPVTELQRLLNQCGASPKVSTSGLFDQRTEAALRRFQQDERLPETGAADRNTIARLREVASKGKTAEAAAAAARVTPTLMDVKSGKVVLQAGDKGPAVRELQMLLAKAGLKPAPTASGEYDQATTRAVAQFQHEQGFSTTGTLDRTTLSRLEGQWQDTKGRPGTKPEPAPTTHEVLKGQAQLKSGQEGAAVRELQEGLNAAGIRPAVTADGKFGDATASAVRRFQHMQGLPQSGVADKTTFARLQGQFEFLPAAAKRAPGYRGKTDALSLGERLTLEERVKGSIGRKLDTATRERMEKVLETDLSTVYVHDDKVAREAARDAQCEAFTLARQGIVHIYFADGAYAPGTPAGDRLLVHELTHARQAKRGLLKRAAAKATGPAVGGQGALEAEAHGAERKLGEDKYATIKAKRDVGRSAPAPSLHEVRSGKQELVRGHEGSAVRRLQELLNETGLKSKIAVTGAFDRATEAAVLGFQAAQGLARTGKVERATFERMESQSEVVSKRPSDAARPAPSTHDVVTGKATLEKRHEGPAVKELQARLNQAGLKSALTTDGRFDDKVVSAVRWFQHEQGLPQTGVVDKQTMDRLIGHSKSAPAAAAKRVPGYRGKNEALSLGEKHTLDAMVEQSVGYKLDTTTRERMEKEIGTDLSSVYVHYDQVADQACKAASAEAVTLVKNGIVRIYFAAGTYRAGTPQTDRLLAHELTHALQAKRGQLKSGAKKATAKDAPAGVLEDEARRAEGRVGRTDKQAKIASERDKDRAERAPTLHDVRNGKAQLERGHEGDAVRTLQELVNKAGAKPPAPVSGRFDRATESALTQLQAAQGLGRTGKADRTTLARLEGLFGDGARFGAKRPTPSAQDVLTGKATIEKDQEGAAVRQAQEALNRAGVKPALSVSGKLDDATERALLWFQREQGLERSGKIDRPTLTRLQGQGQPAADLAAKRSKGRTEADQLTHAEGDLARELVVGSQGFRLDPKTRMRAEQDLQTSLAAVWLHTDRKAQDAAKRLRSDAFTLKQLDGPHIYFASGKYTPSSQQGYGLLLHELTHALQIKRGQLSGPAKLSTDPAAQGLGATENEARAAGVNAEAIDPRTGYQPHVTQPSHQQTGVAGTRIRAPGHRQSEHGSQTPAAHYTPGSYTQGQPTAQPKDAAGATAALGHTALPAKPQAFSEDSPIIRPGPTGGHGTQPPKTKAFSEDSPIIRPGPAGGHAAQPAKTQVREQDGIHLEQDGSHRGAGASPKLIDGAQPGKTKAELAEERRQATEAKQKAEAEKRKGIEERQKAAAEQRKVAKEQAERERHARDGAESKQKTGDEQRKVAKEQSEQERHARDRIEAKQKAGEERRKAVDAKEQAEAEDKARKAAEAKQKRAAEQREAIDQKEKRERERPDAKPSTEKEQAARARREADAKAEAERKAALEAAAKADAERDAKRAAAEKKAADEAAAKAAKDQALSQRRARPLTQDLDEDDPKTLAALERIGASGAVQPSSRKRKHRKQLEQFGRSLCDQAEARARAEAESRLCAGTPVAARSLAKEIALKIQSEQGDGFFQYSKHFDVRALQAEIERRATIGAQRGIQAVEERNRIKPTVLAEGHKDGHDDALKELRKNGKLDNEALLVERVLEAIVARHKGLEGISGRAELLVEARARIRQGIAEARAQYDREVFRPKVLEEAERRGYQEAVRSLVFDGTVDEGALAARLVHEIEQGHGGFAYRDDRSELLRELEAKARAGIQKAVREHQAREEARKRAEEADFQRKKGAAEGPHRARGERARFDDLAIRQSLIAAEEAVKAASIVGDLHSESGISKVQSRSIEEREFLQSASFKVAQWIEGLLAHGSVLDAVAVEGYLADQNVSPEVFGRAKSEVNGLRTRAEGARGRVGQVLSGYYKVGTPRGIGAARPGAPLRGTDQVLGVLEELARSSQPRGGQTSTEGFDPRRHRADDAGKGWQPSFQTAKGVQLAGVDEPGIGMGFGLLERAERMSQKSLTSLSQGTRLDPALRDKFERELKTDLSGVRVHTGREAEEVAKRLGAKAFTVGNEIYFAPGQFDPTSDEGQALLRHELMHVQQERSRPKDLDKRVKEHGGRAFLRPQGKASAYGELIGDNWREREALEAERKLQRGLRNSSNATVDQVVTDLSGLSPLTRELRQRASSIANRAVARATRVLADLGHDRKPLYIEQLDVDIELSPAENEDDCCMRLSAEIIRKVAGRWRHDESTFNNVD